MQNSNENNKFSRRRKGPRFSPSRLRDLKGEQISAELLVKHLTGGSQVKPGKPGALVMLIGLPASGKSTISGAFEAAGWVRLNKDSLRKELYGDESVLGIAREVSALFYQRLEAALAEGKSVLVDNTNVSSLHRRGPLAMAVDFGYKRITHVFLDVPLEECLRRNAQRDRKVPEEALRELAEALTWDGGLPSRREGHLVVLNPGDGVGRFRLNRVRLHGGRRVKKPA